jgi:predicted  nucleic acid-binding Zn-ribbon protein
MITQAERAAEKRRVKLEEIERQVKDGTLTIRKLTAKERKRFPPRQGKAPAKAPRR